ncbi:MAG: ParB/RepB/Spo0J family partition protein [Paludibacteraceae bacterium]|nr:ParB/RepB/Spo0J family partition protein [Paludibacteraceae bacterium]
MAKSVLGRGMGALLEIDEVTTSGSSSVGEIEIEKIERNPHQPRTHFDEEALEELAASIKAVGVIQPITVRKMENGYYQIIAGERRFRASKKAGLVKIPAYIKTAEDENVMKMALVENIQREDLNAIEEALGYQRLVDEYKLTQVQLSDLVGKKRATVANYLRLLKLPAEIQLGITSHKIDMGHARALINVEDPALQLDIYKQILAQDLTVRKVEELVRKLNDKDASTEDDVLVGESTDEHDEALAEYESLKTKLSSIFQTKVEFTRNNKGKGKIVIPFSSDKELNLLINMLDEKQQTSH